MTDRSELANRIECSLYLGTLTGRDRDIILDALRSPALPSEEEIKAVVRRELTDKQDNITLATSHMVDVLRAGCKAVGYGFPTSVDEAADKFAGFVARAVLALLGKTGE